MSSPMRQARLPLGAGEAFKQSSRPARSPSARGAADADAAAPSRPGALVDDNAAAGGSPDAGTPRRARAFLDSDLPTQAVHLHRETAPWIAPAAAPAVSRWRLAMGSGLLLAALVAVGLWAGGRL